jgi:hypothetical protein
MDDWRQRLIDQDREREAKQLEERRRKTEERERKEAEKRQREYDGTLADHKRRFKCHICNTPSSGPVVRRRTSYGGGTGCASISYYTDTLWKQPASLTKCSKCGKWTCDSCGQRVPSGSFICRRHS